ncbi:protein PTHB1 [Copidosoma floridanum]|uniref:protein PTHB1 n=1 Tax=Copidosoma floridanum TaxID=29053 RepID=UPI000C6F4C57|nr:protein PTHB1 [Copidosoma floridanum]
MCKIELELSTYTVVRELQLFVVAESPLAVTDDTLELSNLCERYTFVTRVYLKGNEPPIAPEVTVYASYENEKGQIRVVDKSVKVPLRMLLRPCPAETSAPFSLTIKSTEPVLSFSQIFPEFVGEFQSRQITNSLGLQHSRSGQVVTLLAATGAMQNRYRIQSSDALAVPLVFEMLIARLKDKSPKTAEKLSCGLSQQHLKLVQDNMDAHFESRLRARAALKEIGLLTTQLRNIEKRMLRGMRERNSRSLDATGLPALLDSTYRAIFAHLDQIEAARAW